MARGSKNQPKKKHWGRGVDCKIVFFEQSSHRAASEANGKGFFQGAPGKIWQSHHLLCISSCAKRSSTDATKTQLMEKSLFITVWNINEDPNMLGMPQKKKYMQAYGAIDRQALSKTKEDAAFAGVTPQNIPAHNVDHNTKDGYTDEVTKYLKKTIWDKFPNNGGDHTMDADWLADQLKAASREFQRRLLERGGPKRKGGTVAAWRDRFNDKDWAQPFSMALVPNQRKAGTSPLKLGKIFKRL
jgi:hypothetical protein